MTGATAIDAAIVITIARHTAGMPRAMMSRLADIIVNQLVRTGGEGRNRRAL